LSNKILLVIQKQGFLIILPMGMGWEIFAQVKGRGGGTGRYRNFEEYK